MVTNRDRKSFESRRKKFKISSDDSRRSRFCSSFRHFGTHLVESFRMSKPSWMMERNGSHEKPSYSAIDLAATRRSSKISLWISSIISGVVNVLGRPGWRASQIFSLYVLYTEIYRRQFNPQWTSSDGSRFHSRFLSLLFYFRAPFDYICRFLSGRNIYYDQIFILTFCSLLPPLWSIIL